MGYGIFLSEQARLSLAEAAKKAGTAINSGEGGILPVEFNKAGNYILQFSKKEWAKEDEGTRHTPLNYVRIIYSSYICYFVMQTKAKLERGK